MKKLNLNKSQYMLITINNIINLLVEKWKYYMIMFYVEEL